MNSVIISRLIEKLGWTLFHSLWQFAGISIVIWLVLRAMRNRSPNARYLAQCCGLLSMVGLACVTFYASETLSQDTAREVNRTEAIADLPPQTPSVANVTEQTIVPPQDGADAFVADPADDWVASPLLEKSSSATAIANFRKSLTDQLSRGREEMLARVAPRLSTMMLVWLFGVTVMSVRPVIGWRSVRRLRKVGIGDAPQPAIDAVRDASRKIRLSRAVTIVESALVEVPTVIGWLRPLILLPASSVTGLSKEQFEAVIAHELAHIRRYDYLVNAIQVLLETIFFYHPAVWWVSRAMRIEREKCCDEIAVDLTGKRTEYVKLLLRLEETRGTATVVNPALSATGGTLMDRIKSLTNPCTGQTSSGEIYTVVLLSSVLVGCILWLHGSDTSRLAMADESRPEYGDPVEIGYRKVSQVPASVQPENPRKSPYSESTNANALLRAMQSDPTFATSPPNPLAGPFTQRQAIQAWRSFLALPKLTRDEQVFAWWRIGSLAAYNFDAARGETHDYALAAKAMEQVHAIGGDLVSRETLNAATVYSGLGNDHQERAARREIATRWLNTRSAAMITDSVQYINHNGHCIDDNLMPGGMNLDTAAKKREFLEKELARCCESLTRQNSGDHSPTKVHPAGSESETNPDPIPNSRAASGPGKDHDNSRVEHGSLQLEAIKFSGFPKTPTDAEVANARDVVKVILKHSWAGDYCQAMGGELLAAWTKAQESVPDYVRAEIDRFVARGIYKLQKDLDNEQYLMPEMKEAIVTLQFSGDANCLLRTVDVKWPDETTWRKNLNAYDQLLGELEAQLVTKSDLIPTKAAELLFNAAVAFFNQSRLHFFHHRGYHMLTAADKRKLAAILRDPVAETEAFFSERGKMAFDESASRHSQGVAGKFNAITNYIDLVALNFIEESDLSRAFRAKHKVMMDEGTARFTELVHKEWDARQKWISDRSAERANFRLFRDQVAEVAVTTLREDQPELAMTDLIERLEKRMRLMVEDAQSTVVKRPVQWHESLVDNLKTELHNVFVAKNSVDDGVATLEFFVRLKTVEWKLWQAVNREPTDETAKEALIQQDWLREHILSLPEIPIPRTKYPSHEAMLTQLAAEIANPMQPVFKTALPKDQFTEVQRQLRADNNNDVPAAGVREFNDALLFVLAHFVRYEREFRWGLRAGANRARFPFSKEGAFVGHSGTSIVFQQMTADYPYPEQIEVFRRASNER